MTVWFPQVALVVKNPPAKAGDSRDLGSIPGLGRSPGGGHGNPLQYCCLENPHGQRSLMGYSPWGRKGSDTIEATARTHCSVHCPLPTVAPNQVSFDLPHKASPAAFSPVCLSSSIRHLCWSTTLVL